TPEIDRDQQFVCEKPIGDTTPVEQLGISKTMLVNRLREVRALQAFTRISALAEEDDKSRIAPLSRSKSSWLPAIEVIGEGVFIDLTGDRLAKWETDSDVLKRTNIIRTNHLADIRDRTGAAPEHSFVTPRYILLHTLAHILINEWSLDAGYPAASLRERLYI